MHYTPRTNLVSAPYHKLSTKWAQSIERMDCNMFFNAKSVALADDANLKNFRSIAFELRSHLESWPCTIHHEQTFSRAHTTLSTKWAQFIKMMDCNIFFNAKSVALADDANFKNFWSIGFELGSHLESWPCTIHHEQTLSRPHTTLSTKWAHLSKGWIVICFSMPNQSLSLMMLI